jgi:hypothetical protein
LGRFRYGRRQSATIQARAWASSPSANTFNPAMVNRWPSSASWRIHFWSATTAMRSTFCASGTPSLMSVHRAASSHAGEVLDDLDHPGLAVLVEAGMEPVDGLFQILVGDGPFDCDLDDLRTGLSAVADHRLGPRARQTGLNAS